MKKLFILFVLCPFGIVFNANSFGAGKISLPETIISSQFLSKPPTQVNDTVPRVNLFKRIAEFLKFRKNMREAERQRILDVIRNTFLADSIMANAREIKMLNTALKDTVNQKFDSLVALINDLELSNNDLRNSLAEDTVSVTNDTVISEEDIDQLINRILPLVEQKIDQEQGIANNEMAILKSIRYFYGRARKDTDDIAVKGIGGLRLKRKAPVYAFYPSDMGDNYQDYNMGIIQTLIYDGYDLVGGTGECRNRGDTGTAIAIRNARKAGCRILLTIHGGSPDNMAIFLKDWYQQRQSFISSVLYLLKVRHVDGIHIDFSGLSKLYRPDFLDFIRVLNDSMRSNIPQSSLIITVPPGDNSAAFDLNELNAPNIKFLIDFSAASSNHPGGAVAHLGGEGNGIRSTVIRYLNSNLPPGKFILCLPYYGIKWKINPLTGNEYFVQYLSMDDITDQYKEPTLYDSNTGAAYINLTNNKGQVAGKIRYNDKKTLDVIYDFILQNKLGGIAIRPMKSKIGFSYLWPQIGSKFLTIDTLSHLARQLNAQYVNQRILTYLDSIRREPLSVSWSKVKTYDSLAAKLIFFFERPCKTDFIIGQTTTMAINDTTTLSRIIDSKVQFFRVRRVTKTFLAGFNIFLLAIFMGVGYIYIEKLRKKGKDWAFRKAIGLLLLILASLLILFTFIYLFLSDLIPGFGATYGTALKCYTIPLQVPLIIVTLGILLGVVIMRYLIFPLLKKDDIP